MKTILLGASALIAAVAATPAAAQSSNSLQFNLDADVSTICGVYSFKGTSIPVAFGDLANISSTTEVKPAGVSATYRCNSAAGFGRVISSKNSGKLVRVGSNGDALNSIGYQMAHGGGSGLSFEALTLSSARPDTLAASPAFLNGQTGTVTFTAKGVGTIGGNESPGTTVFAGDYTDVVTIAVTAN